MSIAASNELVKFGPSWGLFPQNLKEAMEFAELLSKSSLIPKHFHGRPGDILVAIEWGLEVGLKPMQALNNIAVINGRPSIWGDAALALVRSSGLLEYIDERIEGDTAVCRIKRKGEPETIRTFSMEDAERAGLLKKPGPWQQYPKRMLQMRARAWALRDVFPDVLSGIAIAEEAGDIEVEAMPSQQPTPAVEMKIERREEPLHKVVGNLLLDFVGGDLEEAKRFAREALGLPEDAKLEGKWLLQLTEDELQRIKARIEAERRQPSLPTEETA
ncbi:MAG: recombinase RecT [Epsilonproteobacteria bacterium]|nr:recombinase RecT [Campylobacterota bacterium]